MATVAHGGWGAPPESSQAPRMAPLPTAVAVAPCKFGGPLAGSSGRRAAGVPGTRGYFAPFTNGRVIHCPWCDCPLLAKKLLDVGNFSGQLSRSANKRMCREIPSLAADDGFLPSETLENTLEEFN